MSRKAKVATCKDPEQPFGVVELGSGVTALQHRQLFPQAKVLRNEQCFRSQCYPNGPKHKLKHRSPPASLSKQEIERPDSSSTQRRTCGWLRFCAPQPTVALIASPTVSLRLL